MNNLTLFEKDSIEVLINTSTGEAFASVRGYARISGKAPSTISRRLKALQLESTNNAQVETPGGLQEAKEIPIKTVCEWLLEDYHKTPTQALFNILKSLYEYQNIDTTGLLNLHSFNKGNKANLKDSAREKQIQLVYQLRYGGQLEFPTVNGRIDLLTDTSIYEFKLFKKYKECLGQLLAYDDCVPQLKLYAILFGVPKSLQFTGSECQRIGKLMAKYGITTKFLR